MSSLAQTVLNPLELADATARAQSASAAEVESVLDHTSRRLDLADFAVLLSPTASATVYLEQMARRAHELTQQHFGRVVRLYAPLYLSNECVNICKYCGFSRDNPILRVTLTPSQVEAEARYLWDEGFRHVLLVAGEHPHFVSKTYLTDCARRLHRTWPSISVEVGPLEQSEYSDLVAAGVEGLVVYQESYDREVYRAMHVSGPKLDFDWRLETVERGYVAGFSRLGIGALLGLAPWRHEAVALAAHARYLLKKCWRSQITISVPRLRPAAGEFEPPVRVSNRDLVQMVCALRLMLPEVGIVLSTREPASLRDRLVPLGVTMMSAGSHTEPGGYTGQGKQELHFTKGGRLIKPVISHIASEGEHAAVQFDIADTRSAKAVALALQKMGYDPVWKDWESVLNDA